MISNIHVFSAYAVYSQNGTWSLLSLVLVFVICGASFCLAFAAIIMALAGRFSRKAPPAPPPPRATGPWAHSAFEETLIENGVAVPRPAPPTDGQAPPNGPDEPDKTAAPQPGPAKAPANAKPTGLWQLLAATAVFIPALVCFSLMDSTLGAMVYFSGSTVVQALLLAAQAFLTVWAIRLQRRRR